MATPFTRFLGHAFPAAIYFICGVVLLTTMLVRLRSQPRGTCYLEKFVPERNFLLLRVEGVLIIVVVIAGLLMQVVFFACHALRSDPFTKGCIYVNSAHSVLFISYGCIGVVMFLEAGRWVPADSWRAMTALASLIASVLWYEHAMHKEDPTEMEIHVLLAFLVFTHFAVNTFSILFPKNWIAFVSWQTMFFVKSIWLTVAGLHSWGKIFIQRQETAPLFVSICLVVAILTFYITAYCRPRDPARSLYQTGCEYERVSPDVAAGE